MSAGTSHSVHQSVLAGEILIWSRNLESPRLILDGTLGGAGHSELLLKEFPQAFLIGMDRDEHALGRSAERLAPFKNRFYLHHGNFALLPELAESPSKELTALLAENAVEQFPKFDCIVLDLGISSDQLDDAERGFRFSKAGPLDMRMDTSTGTSAGELLNTASVDDLARIFRRGGVGPLSRALAHEIIAARPLEDTVALAQLCARVLRRGKAKKGARSTHHPATVPFQALRIAVNEELDSLADFLESAPRYLAPGARLLIISFHSLEDKLVAQAMRKWSREEVGARGLPSQHPALGKLLTKKALVPTEEEIERNPRARSARLRVFERSAQV